MIAEHPTANELSDFLLGKLSDADDVRVEFHVADCPVCQTGAAELSNSDTFTGLLVAAETRLKTEMSSASTPVSAFAPTLDFSSQPFLDDNPPPPLGLVDHPRYRLIRPLGSGGMGSVWLAEHLVLGREVALKVIRPEFLAKPGAAERFRREARAVAQLTHPNIVAAYDAEEADGTHFLAMEYVPGENLAARLKADGPLPIHEACRAARDAALALAAAHAAGLIHRDIKPQNLIRTPDGMTKVLDFGLVTAIAENGELTGENAVVGTPDYIAPEQAEDARTADARSDVYSLGCTLYHLLSGRPPFPEGTMLRKFDAHRGREPEAITGLSDGLAAVLARMMAKKPGERHQSAADVASALAPYCEATVGRDAQAVRSAPRRRWPIAAGLAFGMAAMILAGWVIIRNKDGKEILRAEVPEGAKVEVVPTQEGPPEVAATQRAKEVIRIPLAYAGFHNWSADGKRFGVGVNENGKTVATIWDAESGRRIGQLALPAVQSHGLHFLNDGKLLLQIGTALSRWDLAAGEKDSDIGQLPYFGKSWVTDVTPDGSRYCAHVWNLFGPDEHGVIVADARTGRELYRKRSSHPRSVMLEAPRFSPDGARLATLETTATSGTIRLWDASSGQSVRDIAIDGMLYRSAEFVENGRSLSAFHVVNPTGKPGVSVWDVESGVSKWTRFAEFDSAFLVQAPHSSVLAILKKDGRRVLFADPRSSRVFADYEFRTAILSLQFSPDGKYALLCGALEFTLVRVPGMPGTKP